MKQCKSIVFLLVFTMLLFSSQVFSKEKKELNKDFNAKKNVVIKTVSGDCSVNTGNKDKIAIHLVYTFSDDVFKAEFEEDGDTLYIREKFLGSASGMSNWTVTVPQGTKVSFKTASGDFSVRGLESDIRVQTASGDISALKTKGTLKIRSASGEIECGVFSGSVDIRGASSDIKLDNIQGDVTLSVASGDVKADKLDGTIGMKGASSDIEIRNSKGKFKVETASGDIECVDIIVNESSHFSTASGDTNVQLKETATADMKLSTASGNSVLDYNGNEVKGFFEFTARLDNGKIVSPFGFDKEETFTKYGQKYQRKSFAKNGEMPRVEIKTASGKAVLKK